MPLQVACPSCSFIVIDDASDRPPARCPQCGSRMSCPHCGSVLQRDKDGTGSFVCTRCEARLEGTETGRLTTPEHPADDFTPELPGFELRGEIGRGGMGIVYKAWQISLRREVAIKVLPPALAGRPQFLDRFRNEADLAGKLINAHILPVYDILQTQGVPVIVMPLIVGSDLARILGYRRSARQGPPPRDLHPWALLDDQAYLDGVLPLLDQLVEAVATLHRAEILHRDVKPSNVLVDRDSHVWLSDFGLARMEAEGLGTQVGVPMGTHGYLSPEQARGEGGIDRRADQFSLAVTIYQALTLQMPYGARGPDAGPPLPPVPPSRRQPLLPRSLDTVLLKALALDREDRYASTAEFRDRWRRARSARPGPVPLRRRLALAAGLVAVLTLGIAGLRPGLLSPAVPDVRDKDAIVSSAPTPTPATLARTVYVETEPPEAQVVLVPLDPDTGAYLPEKAIRPLTKTPAEVSDILPGDYLVVARSLTGAFQEVFRRVTPSGKSTQESLFRHLRAWERPDGTVGIPRIVIPLNDPSPAMVKFPGGKFTIGWEGMPGASPSQVEVPSFYLDPTEVTARDFRLLKGTIPEGMPFDSPDDAPVVWITYDGAVDWAERAGKRLPEESEYEFAATNGGKTRFPWGDERKFPPWPVGRVREPAYDRTQTSVPVFGLYSGVVEWTSSWPYPYSGSLDAARLKANPFSLLLEHVRNSRVTRGGTSSVAAGQPNLGDAKTAFQWDPHWREAFSREARYPGLGFRCARSAQPRFLQPGNAAQKNKPEFPSGKTTPDPHP